MSDAKPDNFAKALNIAWWTLNGLSLMGTFTGLVTITLSLVDQPLFARLGETPSWAAAVALAFAAALVIQIFVGGFWSVAASADRPVMARLLCLPSAAVASLVSGIFAAAFWSFTLGLTDGLEDIENDRRFLGILQPIDAFGERMNDVLLTMDALSELMRDKQAEEVRGVSCDGPPSGPGEGPRWRMRVRLTDEAASQAQTARALYDDAYDAIQLPKSVDDAAMAAALNKARQVARDTRISSMQRWIERTANDFRSDFSDPDSGTFVCRDAEAVAKLDAAAALLSAGIDLPTLPPRAAEVGFAESVSNSAGQVWGALGRFAGLEVDRDDDALDATLPAFYAAGLVESAIILLTFLRAYLFPGQRMLSSPRTMRIPPEDYSMVEEELALWNRLARDGSGVMWFHVPENPQDPSLRDRAYQIAYRRRMTPLSVGGPIDISQVAPHTAQALSNAADGASLFTIYRVPKRAATWRREAAAALEQIVARTVSKEQPAT
ncbi:hypothetical protein [uncultured Roseobacter sp.]|uniref:hypothetical protein n=1 Tax=uncultured Roseobacter sp. TaxID=114847 RepID=UPI002630B7A0|nr:hypothetical protein [uncultured Roseobacter sp.]